MSIRSSVTVSLVPEARGGPFVFWHDLPTACESAGRLGFDAVEVFLQSPEELDVPLLTKSLADHNLRLAAMGTGAGWVVRRLHLTHSDPVIRRKAIDFIRSIIDVAGPLGAPAIIGSMQGRTGEGVDRRLALDFLADALEELGSHASGYGVPLLYEPLNRYETDLVNTLEAGVSLIGRLSTRRVTLLADLFHMNIEEVDIAQSLIAAGLHVGHVHFVDSNRRAAGFGHIDYAPIAAALQEIGYTGYASAEALPLPDPDAAASRTMESFRRWFPYAR